MPVPAASIITRACYQAKTQLYTQLALYELNDLLDHIANTIDFSAARGEWFFTFATNLVSLGGGNIVQAAPNPLPMDYLRVPVSGGQTGAQRSSKWYLQGVPYDMVEIDLTEWDDQVQQAGMQSYPYFWAKDLSLWQPVIECIGDLSSASTTVANLGAIDPTTTTATAANPALAPSFTGPSLSLITPGMSISGGIGPQSVIVPGTTVVSVSGGPPPTSLVLSTAPVQSSGLAFTMTGATLLIGNPGIGLPYPPPSGAYNCMIRYQRRMPRLTQAQVDAGAYCWFPDDQVLIDGLAGMMMKFSDDARTNEFIGAGLGTNEGRFGGGMAKYLRLADDTANRAQAVQLDRRSFGNSFSTLRDTKKVGW